MARYLVCMANFQPKIIMVHSRLFFLVCASIVKIEKQLRQDQQQAAQCFPEQLQKRQKVEQQILEHDQVQIVEVLYRQEHRADQVSPDERVILITRASSALRCIHYDIEKSLSEHDLTQLDLDGEGEAPYTQELLHEHLDWIIKNESYGDFSRDASYFRGKLLIVPDQRIQPSSICVYGNVHDLVVCIQIYMTQYRNVIAFTTPLTPEQTITCYVTDPDTIADFLKEYFDKKSITIVLDEPAGID